MKKSASLTEGSISQGLIVFAIPLILTSILQQLYNTADLLIVGRFAGKEAMAAVGATGPITQLLIGLFLGIATGVGVVVAQSFGSRNYQKLSSAVETSMAIAIGGGLVVTVFSYLLTPSLLALMKTPGDIFDQAVVYMRLFFIGTVPLMVYNMGSGILRSMGDSKRPFYYLIVGALVNILLDLVFIAYLGWGVAGAGLATILGQVASAFLTFYNLNRGNEFVLLKVKNIRIRQDVLKEILAIGVPSGLQAVVINLSNVIIQAVINGFGSNAVAGNAAASRIDGFVFLTISSLGMAVMTFAGQNIGAGQMGRLKKGTRVGIKVTTLIIGGLSLLLIGFCSQLIGLFNNNPEVIEYGRLAILYLAPGYIIFGIMEILGGVLRAAGHATVPMVMSIVFMCIFRIFWMYLLLPHYYSIKTVFLSYPVTWILNFLGILGYYLFAPWQPDGQQA